MGTAQSWIFLTISQLLTSTTVRLSRRKVRKNLGTNTHHPRRILFWRPTIQQGSFWAEVLAEYSRPRDLPVYLHGWRKQNGSCNWQRTVSVRATHLFDEQSCVFKLNG